MSPVRHMWSQAPKLTTRIEVPTETSVPALVLAWPSPILSVDNHNVGSSHGLSSLLPQPTTRATPHEILANTMPTLSSTIGSTLNASPHLSSIAARIVAPTPIPWTAGTIKTRVHGHALSLRTTRTERKHS